MTWTLKAPASGKFDLRLSWSPGSNRATNVPVRITVGETIKTVTINERIKPAIDSLFRSIDSLQLEANETIEVVISNADTNGHVIADAVQLLPVE